MGMDVVGMLLTAGFKLGGSRRMAEKYPDQIKVGPDTDWDFYGENCSHTRAALKALGFSAIEAPNRDYWDDLLVDIFKHDTYPIEVLLRNEVDIYSAAFESISAERFMGELWKSSPCRTDGLTKIQFSASVCAAFNRLFIEHGLKPEKSSIAFDDMTPF